MASENYLQHLVDGMSAAEQRKRATSQMTLGALIKRLEELHPDAEVDNLHAQHSYRGYYSDLAFEFDGGKRTVEGLLAECRGCMGQVFQGYKGGDFVMGALTPLWVSTYGDASGMKLMGINTDGTIQTEQEEW